MKSQKDFYTAEVAMQYTDRYDETMISFANNIITPRGRYSRGRLQGGSHRRG